MDVLKNLIKKTSLLFTIILFLLFIIVNIPIFSQTEGSSQWIERLEFHNQSITDILMSLADVKDTSIIPDDTVTGEGSYTFINMEVDRAINLFLAAYDLFLTVEDDIYYVSRIRVDYNEKEETISMDANDVNIRLLVDEISEAIGKTVQYDPLPTLVLDIHADGLSAEEILKMLLVRAPDYSLEITPHYYYIKREAPPTPEPGTIVEDAGADEQFFTRQGEFYSINQKKKRFQELLSSLFQQEGNEFQLLMKRDTILEIVRFTDKTFDELLVLLLEQANADYSIKNGVYYIFEIQQRDVLKKFKNVIHIPLQYLGPNDIQRLIPPDLGSSKYYRMDNNTNSIILQGSDVEIEPIKQFILSIDKPLAGSRYHRYDLNFISANNIRTMLPNKYKQREIITIPNTNSVVMLLTPTSKKYMDEYLKALDTKVPARAVTLKYIKSEDLLKSLPPSVDKQDIMVTFDPSVVFFKGSENKYNMFMNELNSFDKPVPQIRYEVLVLSFSQTDKLDWQQNGEPLYALKVGEQGSVTDVGKFVGSIGAILGLNFDIPAVLGSFSASVNLNADLSNQKARVMTDTTLYGLSGQKVTFDDTETFRYRVTDTSNEGENTSTESIEQGFKLSLEGWVSGENMITMEVNISVIRAGDTGADLSAGALGSTYEKVVTTTIRTASGEPFRLGGLLKQTIDEKINKVPLLGDIPILGLLFQQKSENITNGEVVLYILPHIEQSREELEDVEFRIEKLYNKYLE